MNNKKIRISILLSSMLLTSLNASNIIFLESHLNAKNIETLTKSINKGKKIEKPKPTVEEIIIKEVEKKDIIIKKQMLDSPKIQLAIIIDTSGSMNGLINQVKTQIWKIVNELSKAEKQGKKVNLELALFEYGKSDISKQEGHLQMLSPFTGDLDDFSSHLFSLYTNGGSEWAGRAIDSANDSLQWSNNDEDLKMIVIAGNESFAQGKLSYHEAITNSSRKDISVNTIFCGDYNNGIQLFWQDGASLGNGNYMNINANKQVKHIDTPYDQEIIVLNRQLNETYIAYGKKAKKKIQLQATADTASSSMGVGSLVERVFSKSSRNYNNASWDMVDNLKRGGSNRLMEMKQEELPMEMKELNKNERIKYVEKKSIERNEIQKKINNIKKEREQYLLTKNKETKNNDNTFGTKFINSSKKQLKDKGFILK